MVFNYQSKTANKTSIRAKTLKHKDENPVKRKVTYCSPVQSMVFVGQEYSILAITLLDL